MVRRSIQKYNDKGDTEESSSVQLAMNSKDRSSESLCERSMKMVTNIIKLSSFSIAKASLGTPGRSQSNGNLSISSGNDSYMASPGPLVHRFRGSHQLQETSKPTSYLVEPGEGVGSTYVIDEDKNVDGMASDYIARVHKKNRHYLRETPEDFAIILPPPPRVVK
ncbi:hypothetical protein CRG98_016349 [Punica granatum]|uniref:Uncharacterized protein n=1 Tax=Punica granatum TaxID=22663 RepID=A0A2I0K3N7_PUNGR|nr:hypothetical protein CRG98_016349 [Punica granatum]